MLGNDCCNTYAVCLLCILPKLSPLPNASSWEPNFSTHPTREAEHFQRIQLVWLHHPSWRRTYLCPTRVSVRKGWNLKLCPTHDSLWDTKKLPEHQGIKIRIYHICINMLYNVIYYTQYKSAFRNIKNSCNRIWPTTWDWFDGCLQQSSWVRCY